MADSKTQRIKISGGRLYIPSNVYDLYFKGIQSVVFLNRNSKAFLLPVHQSGGSGLLLKVINSKGDRVINAPEQLSEMNIDEEIEKEISVSWDAEISGLFLDI